MTRTFSDGHPKVLPACNFLSQYYFYNIFLQKSCRFSLQTLTKFEAAKTGSGVGFLRLTAVYRCPRSWTALLQRMLLAVLADRNLSPLLLAHFFTLILLSFIEPTLLDITCSLTLEISIVKSYKVCFSFVLDYLDDGKIKKKIE